MDNSKRGALQCGDIADHNSETIYNLDIQERQEKNTHQGNEKKYNEIPYSAPVTGKYKEKQGNRNVGNYDTGNIIESDNNDNHYQHEE